MGERGGGPKTGKGKAKTYLGNKKRHGYITAENRRGKAQKIYMFR